MTNSLVVSESHVAHTQTNSVLSLGNAVKLLELFLRNALDAPKLAAEEE